jgi:hypothetical protein
MSLAAAIAGRLEMGIRNLVDELKTNGHTSSCSQGCRRKTLSLEQNRPLCCRFSGQLFMWRGNSGSDAVESSNTGGIRPNRKPLLHLYIVLLPLGLSAAAFLFGVLQSYAHYKGEHFGGVLELGGPIIGTALVVIGGFFLVPNPAAFALSVYVHGEAGTHDLVPKDSGEVVMELGPHMRRQPIGQNGQAYFAGIPPSFRGRDVPIWVDSKRFESVNPVQRHSLNDTIVSLEVRKKAGFIIGRIQDENGNPLAGAKIDVAGLSKDTDSAGKFQFVIPGDRLQPELDLTASAAGYATKHYNAVPNANELVIPLALAR